MKTKCLSAISLLALGLACAMPSQAQTAETAQPDERGTFSFVWENDWFGDQDRNYTNGVRMGWLSKARPAQSVDNFLADILIDSEQDRQVRRGFALGHSIYTPTDIDETEFLPDQHPYAGYLYFEGTSVLETEDSLDQISVRLGLIGPSAGGEWVQREFHSLIGAEIPEGWDNQVRDEVGIDVIYDRRLRALLEFGDTDFGVDVIPNIGATLGTLNTNARAGLTMRIGQDLKSDFGPPRVRPSLAGAGYFAPDSEFSWYLFAGAEGRYVAHDYILDGSLFRDDFRSITTKREVLDLQAGLVVQYNGIQLGLTYVERTKQFEEQQEPQRFGAVSLSFKT
ncbi:lipid A deacylase LpxR family protein [Ponticaulis profundi]|uniref:Lipid A deacylase LpxR family protein n=1 Tax=Ponticaulis profundi TaxID=2665222 RepID=A0ABW1SBG6_9PROT